MPMLDSAHAEAIRQAITQVNASLAAGMSPVADGLYLLDAIAALQADLRAVLEAERRRGLLAVV